MKNPVRFFTFWLTGLLAALAVARGLHLWSVVVEWIGIAIGANVIALLVTVIRFHPRWRWVVIAALAGLVGLSFVQVSEVRRTAQDNSVATYQIQAAMTQIFVESPERVFLDYEDVIGPKGYMKTAPRSVVGEDYHVMFPLRIDWEMMPVTMDDGRQVIVLRNFGTVVVSPRGEVTGPGNAANAYRALLHARNRRDRVRVSLRPNGSRFETTWHQGVEAGPFRAYYKTGELWAEATYVAGKPVGRHVVYNRSGKIIHETTFAPRP